MEWDVLLGNPQLGTSYDAYNRVSVAATRIEAALKYMGYGSRANTPNSGYDLVCPPYMVWSGRIVTPGVSVGTTTMEMPACFRASWLVRTASSGHWSSPASKSGTSVSIPSATAVSRQSVISR